MALGNIYQSLAQSIGLSMQNAVQSQQQQQMLSQAASTMGLLQLYGVNDEHPAITVLRKH
ncbi:RebB family R body protein [Massilia sp. W12]|uniref:RebB family R body protein n=1 Tax=Massilia sp. W12 TaxID=3126507 RepID=UPI0030D114DC